MICGNWIGVYFFLTFILIMVTSYIVEDWRVMVNLGIWSWTLCLLVHFLEERLQVLENKQNVFIVSTRV